MRYSRLVLVIGLIIAIFTVVFSVGVVRAADSSAELAADQTVNGMYMRAADNVSVRGRVNGDVVVAGSVVEIDGTVTGSVYAAAERVMIRGVVRGNIHVVGSDVEISSADTSSVFAAGSNVRLGESLVVQNLFAAGGELSVQGKVSQNTYMAGNKVVVAAKISGDVAVAGEQIIIRGSSEIGGNLNYSSQNQVVIENDRSIQGSIKRSEPDRPLSTQERIWAQLTELAYWLAANIFIAAILLAIMPKLFIPTVAFQKRPLHNYLKAITFVVVTPILLVVTLFTVIGIPLVFIAALLYILILVIAPTASAYFVGAIVKEKLKWSKIASQGYIAELATAVVGFIILAVAGLVPVIGGLISLAAFFLGVAVIIERGFTALGREQDKKIATGSLVLTKK